MPSLQPCTPATPFATFGAQLRHQQHAMVRVALPWSHQGSIAAAFSTACPTEGPQMTSMYSSTACFPCVCARGSLYTCLGGPCLLSHWSDYKLLRLCDVFFILFIAGMNTGTGKQLSRKSFSPGMFSTKCHHTLSGDTCCYPDGTKRGERSFLKAAAHQPRLQLPEKPSPPLTPSLPSPPRGFFYGT